MAWFSKKSSSKADPPVRRDQVMNLIKLGMDASDHGDRELLDEESPNFDKAWAARNAAMQTSTQAEIDAADAALKRGGYHI